MRKLVYVVLCLIFMFFALSWNVSLAQEELDLTLEKCVEMTLKNNEQILKALQELAEAESVLAARPTGHFEVRRFWHRARPPRRSCAHGEPG